MNPRPQAPEGGAVGEAHSPESPAVSGGGLTAEDLERITISHPVGGYGTDEGCASLTSLGMPSGQPCDCGADEVADKLRALASGGLGDGRDDDKGYERPGACGPSPDVDATKTGFFGGELQDLAAAVARRSAHVFREAGWEWRENGVPDEAQIAACVAELIGRAVTLPAGYSTGTGRFNVCRDFEDGYEILSVGLEVGDLTRNLDEPNPAGTGPEPEGVEADRDA